ncbi:MAG TPA: hypothetical protein DIU07_01765 [Rhodobacteraceae bacterium]|nr:hypothetical protein [Paracoccaceae bacterium]
MDLPKVEGTQVRGKVYHLNLRIKPEIQDLYGGKSHLRGSLRTSDPEVARREVQRRRDELHEKEQERVRQAEVEDLVAQLSPEQRAAYDAAGGLEGLLEGFEQKRPRAEASAQDAQAPQPATQPQPAEPAVGHEAASDPIDNDDWPLGDGALTFAPAEDEDEEKPFTLADLLEEYLPTLEYEAAEAMRHIVRLFTDFHGDIAYDELTIAHLDEFAEAARGLPADMMAKLGDGTYVRDLPYAEMVAWTVHADARAISETTRFQYVALLKELMLCGVPRYRRGDPWSEYRLQILRRETVEPATKKSSRRFAPSEWTFSDAMMRLLEVAIIVFVVLVFILLWQSRT